ncbi:hypothetical protein DY000_02061499 [Brassica cretica]|uniref:Uncharacterized protein n=1 Tax=Brassica cretica TaxID=69181 RepID=A0ABQ7AYL2_BRACR|nr:hypothetical protein DY000_02061499 [Brassica cretica]
MTNPNLIENLKPLTQGVPDLSTRPQSVPQLATSACSRDTISACSPARRDPIPFDSQHVHDPIAAFSRSRLVSASIRS